MKICGVPKTHFMKAYKPSIIRFDWMGYPVIGLPHFEERRTERLTSNPMSICSVLFPTEDEAIRHCFKLLEEKHSEIESFRTLAMPNSTVFVTGFETDDYNERGNKLLWFFMVFSIDTKLSEMNGVKEGATSVNLISTGLFDRKNKTQLKVGETEVVLGYCDRGNGFEWTGKVPR